MYVLYLTGSVEGNTTGFKSANITFRLSSSTHNSNEFIKEENAAQEGYKIHCVLSKSKFYLHPSKKLLKTFETLQELLKDHGLSRSDLRDKQFSVLRKFRSKFDCLIFEMLFIKELKPGLNTQKDSVRAKLFT